MIYITNTGTIDDAVRYVQENGGQLIISKDKMVCTIIRGCYCVRFYNPKYDLERLHQISWQLGIRPFNGMTEGTLIKKFLKDVIQLNPKGTYFGRTIRAFAQKGWHWGYYKFQPHETGDYIELDIKAAYLSSLLTFPSFFFHEPMSWEKQEENAVCHFVDRMLYGGQFSQNEYCAWKDDGGALKRLAAYRDFLPKELRLKLVGIIASQKFDAKYVQDGILRNSEIHRIEWGGAFNAVQLAVLKLYYTCAEVVKIAGEYCVRWHTDGGIFRADMPRDIEEKIVNLLGVRGLTLRCKSAGLGYFWDLNTGFLGYRGLCGNKAEVTGLMRSDGLKFRKQDITNELAERWWHFLVNHKYGGGKKFAYGFFQPKYAADEHGYLQKDGGTFYCFACRIHQKTDNLFITEEIPLEQAQKFLYKL